MEYSDLVEEHFRHPRGCGVPPPGPGATLRGAAGSAADGCLVVFHARTDGDRLAALGFEALACPHVIAACSRMTELLAGATREAALAFDARCLEAQLPVPAAKRGRLLIVADALRNCLAAWDTTQLAATPHHPH